MAKDTLTHIGDLLERMHAVSGGQLFWRYPGWGVCVLFYAVVFSLVMATVYLLFKSMEVV